MQPYIVWQEFILAFLLFNIPLYKYTAFTYFPVYEYFRCLQFFVITQNSTMNILAHLKFFHQGISLNSLVHMGEGNGNPLQYSCLESTVDKGAWWAAVHGVAQSWTRLKQLSMHALEKGMATHFSVLAWRIPGTEKPGGLPSMGSHRVKHD